MTWQCDAVLITCAYTDVVAARQKFFWAARDPVSASKGSYHFCRSDWPGPSRVIEGLGAWLQRGCASAKLERKPGQAHAWAAEVHGIKQSRFCPSAQPQSGQCILYVRALFSLLLDRAHSHQGPAASFKQPRAS